MVVERCTRASRGLSVESLFPSSGASSSFVLGAVFFRWVTSWRVSLVPSLFPSSLNPAARSAAVLFEVLWWLFQWAGWRQGRRRVGVPAGPYIRRAVEEAAVPPHNPRYYVD